MEIREAITTAKMIKNHFRVFQRIEELLLLAQDTEKLMESKQKTMLEIDERVNALLAKEANLGATLKAREDEFVATQIAKGNKIIFDATEKARKDAQLIIAEAKADIGKLVKEKTALEDEIVGMRQKYTIEKASLSETVAKLKVSAESLSKEIGQLTFTRDELQKQVNAVKEKFTAIVT